MNCGCATNTPLYHSACPGCADRMRSAMEAVRTPEGIAALLLTQRVDKHVDTMMRIGSTYERREYIKRLPLDVCERVKAEFASKWETTRGAK